MENSSAKAKGRILLKTSGVLAIIYSVAVLLLSGSLLVVEMLINNSTSEIGVKIFDMLERMGYISAIAGAGLSYNIINIVFIVACAVTFSLFLISLITGIINLKNSDRSDKSTICLVFNIIFLAVAVIVSTPIMGTIEIIISDIIPILGIVGSILNKFKD